jgi:hypothetical protein
MATEPVRAMSARYEGWCAAFKCGAPIHAGHILYRVHGQSLCYECGRRYVDTLPLAPRPATKESTTHRRNDE